MSDFPPAVKDRADLVFSTVADASSPIAQAMLMVGSVPSSNVLGTANQVLYYPIIVKEICSILRYGWINGATVAGNVNMGIFDLTGTAVANSVLGSTAQSGVSAFQLSADLATPAVLRPGNYLLAFVSDSATSTFWKFGPTTQLMRISGCAQMASNFALGASTYATITNNSVVSCAAYATKVV